MVINGRPHGPQKERQPVNFMRSFNDGESVYMEPWRAKAFPVIKNLMVDRSAFDRVIQAGDMYYYNWWCRRCKLTSNL